jgi:acyl carrier protein
MELDVLKKVIAEVLSVDEDEIHPDTTFVDDLGADSLDIFQIIMGVEEELDIEINTDEIDENSLKTVEDAVELIKKTEGNED